jgi:cytochrome c2
MCNILAKARKKHMKRDFLLRILEHSLAAALLVVVPSLWLGEALWRAELSTVFIVVIFAGSYFVCAVALIQSHRPDARPDLRRVLLGGIAAFGIAFMFLAFAEWRWPHTFAEGIPRIIPFTSLVLGLLLLVALFWIRNAVAWKVLVLVAALLAGLAGQMSFKRQASGDAVQEVTYVDTSLYVLKRTTYRNWVSDAGYDGGGIVTFEDGYLLSGGDGQLYFLTEQDDRSGLDVEKLNYRVPVNPEDLESGGREVFGEAWQSGISSNKLRVADLLVQERPDGSIRLLVSHHFWKSPEKCFVLRISMLEGSRQDLLDKSGPLKWRTLYDTTPCLTLNAHGHRGVQFASLQSGGAMGLLDENELLLTVGDHEFDGWNRTPALPQDETSSYGKIMLVRIDTGEAEIYSRGHRNPQGLYVDPAGVVWSSEHGPRGGDELNRIQRGANYGWPLVTYGTDYRMHRWPLDAAPGQHEGFEKPVVALVPSLALSALIGISGKLFDAWRGDLLLISLKGEMRRIRAEEGRAMLVESITMGGHLRGIAEGRDGRILLWTDRNDLEFLEPTASDSAESLVFQCTGCHTLSKWEHSSIGPNLWQVVGRRVGSVGDYSYSQAMLNFGGSWTKERLDQFLANPGGTVPGTKMQIEGIPDAAQREQLIEYFYRSGQHDPGTH